MGVLENKGEISFYNRCGKFLETAFSNKIRLFYYTIIACQYFAITLTASNSAVFYLTRGISIDWLAYLGTFSALAIVIFEFPTGLISDRFGSAVSIVISMALRGGAALAVAVCYGPAMFCLITVVSSIGSTFYSGAAEAWIFNKDKSIKEDMTDFFSNVFVITGGARIIGGLTGALLASRIPEIPFMVSGLMLLLLSVIFILFELGLTGEKSKDLTKTTNSFFYVLCNDAKDTMMLIYNNKRLFHMSISCVCFIIFCGIPLIYWQPFFHETTGSVGSLGLIWAGFTGMNIFGSFILKSPFMRNVKDANLFSALVILCGFPLCISALMKENIYCSVSAFFLYHFFLGVIGPVRGKLVNQEIYDEKRASILSFISFLESSGSIIGFSLAGYLVKFAGMKSVFLFSTIPLLISFLSAIKVVKMEKQKRLRK